MRQVTSIIKGYYGTYSDAYEACGSKYKKSRKFSIQRSSDSRMHPWVLIYYGNFWTSK